MRNDKALEKSLLHGSISLSKSERNLITLGFLKTLAG